jgi:hypothetical protein
MQLRKEEDFESIKTFYESKIDQLEAIKASHLKKLKRKQGNN